MDVERRDRRDRGGARRGAAKRRTPAHHRGRTTGPVEVVVCPRWCAEASACRSRPTASSASVVSEKLCDLRDLCVDRRDAQTGTTLTPTYSSCGPPPRTTPWSG